MNILIGTCYNSIQTIRVNVKPFFLFDEFHNWKQVLGMCRTEHLSPFLISLRLNDHPLKAPNNSMPKENKKIAYLIDLQTIQILDLSR
jgi:hypothetical protein